MTDARETIRRGVEALPRVERRGRYYDADSSDTAAIVDAFEALLKIARGEDAYANRRAASTAHQAFDGTVTWEEGAERILRAALGLEEGDDADTK